MREAAGGFYSDSAGGVTQGFALVERHGRWGKPIEVPGLGALNQGGAPESTQCRAPRRAAAPAAERTPTATRTRTGSW